MCFVSGMERKRSPVAAFAIRAVFTVLSSCPGPISDPGKLKAINAEARSLMASHPLSPQRRWAEVPKNEWPSTIASLQPHSVTVSRWGVNIMTKPDFDGGWGYHVTQDKRDLPMLAECYSEESEGVFWHGPC